MTKRSPNAKPNAPIKTKAKAAPGRRASAQATTKARAPRGPTVTTPKMDAKPARMPPLPGGKLGLIVDQLGMATGATIEELAGMTGWQTHTVRAALSRLRTRGFAMRLDRDDERRAYRLDSREG